MSASLTMTLALSLLPAAVLTVLLWPRVRCALSGHRYAITNRTRAGLYCPVRVCVRCGRDAP